MRPADQPILLDSSATVHGFRSPTAGRGRVGPVHEPVRRERRRGRRVPDRGAATGRRARRGTPWPASAYCGQRLREHLGHRRGGRPTPAARPRRPRRPSLGLDVQRARGSRPRSRGSASSQNTSRRRLDSRVSTWCQTLVSCATDPSAYVERHRRGVLDARVAEAARGAGARPSTGIAEQPAQHVDVVDRVLDERAAARPCATSLRHVEPYMPWIGKYWSSRSTVASGRPYSPRRDRARRRSRNTGAQRSTSPTWCGTRSSAAATRSHVGEVGRERLLAEDGAARVGRGSTRFEMGRGPRADPHRRRPRRRARRAMRPARRRGARRRVAARSGSASYVAVSAASTSPASGELLERVRVHGADVAAPDQPDPHHRGGPLTGARRCRAARPGRTAPSPKRSRTASTACSTAARRSARASIATDVVVERERRAPVAPRRPIVELRQRDAEQPDAAPDVEPGEQLAGGVERRRVLTSVGSGSVRARVLRLEVAEADLQRDRARRRARPRAARTVTRSASRTSSRSHSARVRRSVRERLLGADRLRLALGDDRRGRRRCARARAGARPSDVAERADEHRLVGSAATSPIVRTPMRSSVRQRRGADAPEPRTPGSGVEERALGPGRDDEQPVGLRQVARELGEELRRRDADRRGEPGLGADARAQQRARSRRRCPSSRRAPRDVEERLVDRELLDERRDRREDRHHLAALLGVARRSAARGTPPCGHARRARAIGIAECTPNARAS